MVSAFLQARVTSTRLPGKVLRPVLGVPMLGRQIERLRRSRRIDQMVVVTSVNGSDDKLARFCQSIAVECFRGSLEDVLDRYYQAALRYRPEHIVRLTGDCPLTDPELIDTVIRFHLEGGYDYSSNTIEPTFPDGLDVEVFRFAALERAWKEAVLPSHREHVTAFLYNQPKLFRLGSYLGKNDFHELRWTVDDPQDLRRVRTIYRRLYPKNPNFGSGEVYALFSEHPELFGGDNISVRNEGLIKSLLQDEAFLKERKVGNVRTIP